MKYYITAKTGRLQLLPADLLKIKNPLIFPPQTDQE